jgi:hypothetical protein
MPDAVDESELSLRKKPVRKASVKAPVEKAKASRTKKLDICNEKKPAKPTEKSKVTRTKQRVVVHEEENTEAVHDVEEAIAETSRRTTTRAKKEADSGSAPKKAPARSQNRAGPKLSATANTTKQTKEATTAAVGDPLADDVQPAKAGRATRATRSTRATVAKEKSRPLSPKKITQISRATSKISKTTKSTSTAGNPKTIEHEPTEVAKRVTRKRAFSDENADSLLESGSLCQSPILRAKRPRKVKAGQDETIGNALLGSPSQDADSKAIDFTGEPVTHVVEARLVLPAELTDKQEDDNLDTSIDELCGPTTPMKRCTPHQSAADLTHVQSTSRLRTPVRRFRVFDGQLRTPKTQRPYAKNDRFEFDSAQSMTVARARDHAMVFRKLEALPEMPDIEHVVENKPVPEDDLNQSIAAANEPSEVIYEFDLSEVQPSQQDDEDYAGSQDTACSSIVSIEAAADLSPTQDARTSANEAITTPRGLAVEDLSLCEDIENHVELERPAPVVSAVVSPDQSFVPISQPVALTVNDPALQTLVWNNLEQSSDMDVSTLSPSGEATQDVMMGSIGQTDDSSTIEHLVCLDMQTPTLSPFRTSSHEKHVESARQSMDATVHFSEFIDAGALSETSQLIDSVASSTIEEQSVHKPTFSENHEHENATSSFEATPFSNQLPDVWSSNFQFTFSVSKPQFAMSTISSRRKSMPSVSRPMPTQANSRPKTSDGLHSAEVSPQVMGSWLDEARAVVTPTKRFQSKPASPRLDYNLTRRIPKSKTPAGRKLVRACKTEGPKVRVSAVPSQDLTASLCITPVRARRQVGTGRGSQQASMPKTPTAKTPTADESTDEVHSIESRKRNFDDYSRTAMPASRFRSPVQKPAQRPASARKPMSMREQVMRTSTMQGSRTPTKTPLKAPAMTPGFVCMTPHPSAPLRGVFALVEVFTNEGASASSSFVALLQRLGARTTKIWSSKITHVVFKDGSPTTLQRLRLHNKEVAESGNGVELFCVNSRWVSDCDADGTRLDEHDESYAVDVDEVPRAGKRRRKSMEPSALMVVGGNIVRDRKSSLGRSTLSRMSMKCSTPEPEVDKSFDMDSPSGYRDDSENEPWSPSTPAYLAEPSSLVQQTAPADRIQKLDMKRSDKLGRGRRLTFWNGGA